MTSRRCVLRQCIGCKRRASPAGNGDSINKASLSISLFPSQMDSSFAFPALQWSSGGSRLEQDLNQVASIFLAAIKSCGSNGLRELDFGKRIHLDAVHGGLDSNLYLTNSLLSLFAKCGSLADAGQLFEDMPIRDVVSWNGMIKACVMNNKSEAALELFSRMDSSPDELTFIAALTACANLAAIEEGHSRATPTTIVKLKSLDRGMEIHARAVKTGYECHMFLASTVIDMYAKCGDMVGARAAFDKMPHHDIVAWNALILGYVENGEAELALELYSRMELEPDARAFVAAVAACASLAEKEQGVLVDNKLMKLQALNEGKVLHARAHEYGAEGDIFVASTLVDLYTKCGSLVDARAVFDKIRGPDVVAWNSLVLGYAENGEPEVALELFAAMQASGNCEPNARTYVAAMVACLNLAAREEGKLVEGRPVKVNSLQRGMALHSEAAKSGYDSHIFLANALIAFYAECGSLLDLRMVFDRMQRHDVVTWSALILGYAENGENELALRFFWCMKGTGGCAPNTRTYISALIACTNLADLETGRMIHAEIRKAGFQNDMFVANSLVDFYGKCSCMADAKAVFDSMKKKTLVAWSALISGYSCQGSSEQVFNLFDQMVEDGFRPDGVTFLSVLTVCSHAGLVDKGRSYFDSMSQKFGLTPGLEHYNCMIDMFGRANCLVEAVQMAKEMPYEATVVTWTTLLGACQKWQNVVLGKLAFDSLVKLEAKTGVAYVLMGNIYGNAGLRGDQDKIFAMKRSSLAS